jgi:hypothetical protein
MRCGHARSVSVKPGREILSSFLWRFIRIGLECGYCGESGERVAGQIGLFFLALIDIVNIPDTCDSRACRSYP